MTRLPLLFAAALLFTACSKKAADVPASGAGAGSGSAGVAAAPAPIVVPPYTPAADTTAPIKAAIAATDRADKDRAIDAGRKPGEVFTFFRIAPGQHVAEIFAGGGYSTEMLARIVGATGVVYAQNSKDILDKFARGPFAERLAKPINKAVVGVERELDAPLPPEAHDLDAVVDILNYHDTVWLGVDRAKMNAAIFAALKPGGVYGIVDHSGPAGSGVADVKTTHRIDEEVVKTEILAAGFKLDAESDVLRNPADKRDWNDSPKEAGARRGTSDRFVLRFVKP